MLSIGVVVDIQEYTRYLAYFMSQDTPGAHAPRVDGDIEDDWRMLCGPGLSGLHVLVDRVGRAMEGCVADFERAMIISVVMASRGNEVDRNPWDVLYEDNPAEVVGVGIELTASPLPGYARFVYHFCETTADAATIEGFPLVYIRTMAGADAMAVSRYRRGQARSRVAPRIDVNLNATDFDGIHPSPETQATFNRALAGILEGQTSVGDAGDQIAQVAVTANNRDRLARLLNPDQRRIDEFINQLASGSSISDIARREAASRPAPEPTPELQRYRIISRRYRIPEGFANRREAATEVPDRVLRIFGQPADDRGREVLADLARLLGQCPSAVRFMDEVLRNPDATALNLTAQYRVVSAEYMLYIDHRLPWDGSTPEFVEGLPTDRGHFSILGVDFSPCGSSSPELETPPEPKRQSGRRLKRSKPITPKEESNDVPYYFDKSSKDPVNQRFARRARRAEQARHPDDPGREH